MKNSKLLFTFLLAFSAVLSANIAHADGGFDSVSDTNNFKANGTTVLTLTGSSKYASFMGDASFAGSIYSTGTITAPQGVVSTRYGSSFVANAWDAVYGSIDNQTSKNYDLIGTYHGWDTDSVYIAGYNAGDTNGRATAKSISFGGWGTGSSTTALVDLINHRVGIGTTTPQSTLDVNGNVSISNSSNTATLCLNGNCMSQLPDFTRLFRVESGYSVGSGTKTVSCPDNSVRISCGFYTDTGGDGRTLLTSSPVEPVAPRGCSLYTPEGQDGWAVTAYCAPI